MKKQEIAEILDGVRTKAIEAFPGWSYIEICEYNRLASTLSNYCGTWVSRELDGREILALMVASCW